MKPPAWLPEGSCVAVIRLPAAGVAPEITLAVPNAELTEIGRVALLLGCRNAAGGEEATHR